NHVLVEILSQAVGTFAVLTQIQTETLLIFGDSKSHDGLQYEKNHRSSHNRKRDRGPHGDELRFQQSDVPIDQTVGPGGINRFRSKNAGGKGANNSSHTVN